MLPFFLILTSKLLDKKHIQEEKSDFSLVANKMRLAFVCMQPHETSVVLVTTWRKSVIWAELISDKETEVEGIITQVFNSSSSSVRKTTTFPRLSKKQSRPTVKQDSDTVPNKTTNQPTDHVYSLNR